MKKKYKEDYIERLFEEISILKEEKRLLKFSNEGLENKLEALEHQEDEKIKLKKLYEDQYQKMCSQYSEVESKYAELSKAYNELYQHAGRLSNLLSENNIAHYIKLKTVFE